jgi:N12 class adenine-specific DNA methylase
MPFEFDDEQKQSGGSFVFDAETPATPPKKVEKPSVVADIARNTGPWLAEGVNNILGAVPNLVAPDSGAAEFFDSGAEYWRGKQSESVQQRQAQADQRISKAGEDGVLSQIGAAAGEYVDDPVLAARLAVTNIPSFIPGLGAGKLVQAGAAARGLSVAQQAALATGVAGGTNAALNAGGARGDAYDDIKKSLIAKGVSPEDATDLALQGSKLPAAVGAVTGFVSGKTGLEKSLLGQASVGSALKQGGKAIGSELAGELVEEVAPKLTTNFAVQEVDPSRSLTQDIGRTIVDTAVGAGPTSIAAGVSTGIRSMAPEEQAPAPAVAPSAQGGAPVNASEILGTPTSRPAKGDLGTNDTAEAEKALQRPAVNPTALDRVSEIDTLIAAEPAGSEQSLTLQEERAQLTKDWPTAAPGNATTFSTEAGAKLDAQYALIDADQLITSHDENLRPNSAFPQDLQPRERDRAASELQVSGIVQRLDPARLGLSADSATGAPIVGADGLVESGNARTIALKRIYQANGQKAADYKQFLADNSAQFGITPESVQTMAKPVLVRVRSTPVNRAEFARQANASTVAQMSPSEQAKSDAARIDVLDDLNPDDNGDFVTSRDFIRRFVAKLPSTEQGAMLDASGGLSSTGYARVRNAVLAKAYGDSPVLARMVESMDDNLRNISKALMTAAPKVAQVRQAVAQGARFDADITPDLVAAVEELSRLKDSGTSVTDALAQAGMFGEQFSEETKMLLQFLAENVRRPRRMADFIVAYMEALDAAGDPNQGSLLDEVQAPSKGELLTAAQRTNDDKQPNNGRAETDTNTQRGEPGKDAQSGAQGAGQSQNAAGDQGGNEGAGDSKLSRGQRSESNTQQVKGEWVAFPKESGTIGIPRADMPQIKGEHRGALIQFLAARGINHKTEERAAADFKPTQAEFSVKKAERWGEIREGADRSVLVSSDGHILDGHHQWVAALATNDPVKAIVLDAPIRELLTNVFQFPSVKSSDGATSAADGSSQARQDFKAALADLADILMDAIGGRAMMVPANTPKLRATLVRLFVSAIDVVGTDLKAATKWVKDQLKANAETKPFWNKITDKEYQAAALEAVEKAAVAKVDDLFSAAEKRQADLFGDVEQAPAVAKIKGRAYDYKRDMFTPPATDSFIPAELLARAREHIKKFRAEAATIVLTNEERTKAEGLLRPMLEKAEAAKVSYDQKIIDIAQRTGALGQMIPNELKKIGRASVKLVEERFNTNKMRDLLRSTIVVTSYDDAQAVVDAIYKEFEVVPGRVKNRTESAIKAKDLDPDTGFLASGYGDVLINVMHEGVQAEIQINVPEMLAAKGAEGHQLYDIEREQPEGSEIRRAVELAQSEFYASASAAALARQEASGKAMGSDKGGQNRAGSSELPNSEKAPRPGMTTAKDPLSSSKNSQPGGKDSGTLIATPLDSNVADKSKNGYATANLFGDSDADTTADQGSTEGKGPSAVQGTGGKRRAGEARPVSGRPGAGADSGNDNAGSQGKPLGQAAAGGTRRKNEDGGKPQSGASAESDPGIPAGPDIPTKSGRNYGFGPDDLTYEGSWPKKAEQNVEAVELLKRLQAEGRQATREEQQALAKFIGWGSSELANNLFGSKLDKSAAALSEYADAIAAMDKLGRDYLQKGGQYRGQYADDGYYKASNVLRALGKIGPHEYPQRVTRADLDAAKPKADVIRWLSLRDRLKAALTKDEWADAARSTQYAHYTSKGVVTSMWKAMSRMGFNGGHILEPGAGIGVFAGLMPQATALNSSYTGIEFDAITGGILQQLFPDERILVESFIDTKLPKNFYDVAIGNPPFSGTKILSDPEYAKMAMSLHDYFFAKSIDRVKPGGLVMYVTSRYTMDKLDDKARKYLSDRADLVGAIRLPQTAFKQNAGTDVVTDVLFLRKKVAGETFEHAQAWSKSVPLKVGAKEFPINEYFHAHPEMVLGTPSDTGKMQNSPEPQYTVLAPTGDIEALFDKAVEGLPADIYKAQRGSSAEAAKVREIDFNPKAKKEGNYYVTDAGVLMQRESGVGQRVELRSPKDVELVKDFVPLRDALKQAHYDQLNDGEWETSLAALQKQYAAFTKKHGQINQFTSKTVKVKVEELDEEGTPTGRKVDDEEIRRSFPLLEKLVDDPDWTLVQALENLNEDTGEITASNFLSTRVLGKPQAAEAATPVDALLTTLNDMGRVDIPTIAARVGLTEAETIEALGSSVYDDPEQGWVTADDYLSGNVKRKLELARTAAKGDRRFERNVSALEANQPEPLTPSQIDPRLGMNWIPGTVYQDFISDITSNQVKVTVEWNPRTKNWNIEAVRGHKSDAATNDWGTLRRSVVDLLDNAVTGRPVRIESSDSDGKKYFDAAATEAANEKLKGLHEKFASWVFSEPNRTDMLVRRYNDTFNTTVPRKFDGSHLNLPGSSKQFSVFDHVKRGAWRIIQSGNTYLAHAVGSGKTFQMVISAMEQKRLGLIKKPMVVVPNHMLKQFSHEWQQLYPAARLMVADEHNFHTDNRRRFVSRVALSDLDGVVITHSAFKLLDLDPEFKTTIIQEQLEYMRAALEEAGGDPDKLRFDEVIDAKTGKVKLKARGSGNQDPKVKRIEKQLENLEQKLLEATSSVGKDQNVRFDELGVDFLYVDEAHEYRKLDFATSRQVKGISPMGSARAFDLYMKSRYLESKTPGRSLVLASGTPVTNTVAELYTVQKMLGYQALVDKGIEDFDSWAAMFGREKTALEPNAAGKYELVTRFQDFANVPELTQMFREFADVLTSDHLAEMLGDKRPKVEGGSRSIIVTPETSDYEEFRSELEARMETSKAWKPSKDEPNNPDPVIRIIGDGRLAAIDMRFMDPKLPSDPDSKLNRMIDDVIVALKETADYEYKNKAGEVEPTKGATAMVFSDLGFGAGVAESRGFNARAWFEKRLRDAGIPMNQVAFMSDYKKSSAKLKLFSDLNAGRMRLLIGSSKNMGTGVNAQQRLKHLFHLDSPWYPADLEQREGRIVRQGNKNPLVRIKAYAAKGTYDQQMWGQLANKQMFIDKAMSGDPSVRKIEDAGSADLMAMVSGMVAKDPRVLELAGLNADIAKMQRLYQAHEDARATYRGRFSEARSTAEWNEARLPAAEKVAGQAQDLSGDKFIAKVGKTTLTERAAWAEALIAKYKDLSTRGEEQAQTVGEISEFKVTYTSDKVGGQFRAYLMLEVPSPVPLVTDIGTSPMGVAMRAQNTVVDIARAPAKMRERIAEARAQMDGLSTKMTAPFPMAAMLADKVRERDALIVAMASEGKAKEADEAPEGTALSRGPGGGMDLATLTTVVNRIKAKMPNMSKVHVLAGPAQAPEALKFYIQKQDAWDDVEGAMHNGELYMFASGLSDPLRAEHVLAEHEAAHLGLRAVLGDKVNATMQAIWAQNADVRKAATELQKRGRLTNAEAVEEVIVDIPTARLARLKGWRNLVMKVRDFLAGRGFEAMAEKLTRFLAGTLNYQQRADFMVADLVRAARGYVAGKRQATPLGKITATMLSDGAQTLAADLEKQEKWLTAEARARGFKDIEDLLEKDYPTFEKLATLWREKNPADALLSRSAPGKTAQERAETIVTTKAATRAPLDTLARMATRVTGVEKVLGAVYDRAAVLLDRYTPETIKAGVVSDYGVPAAVIDKRSTMQASQRQQLRGAGTLLEKLATLTRAESRIAYEWMNMDGSDAKAYLSMMQGLPEESVKTLTEVQKLIDQLSQEAMRLGQLSPEAYKANRMAYLRRSYVKHTAELTQSETNKRARAISILGDQYKGRGMTEQAAMKNIANVAPEWWGRKLQAGKADASLKNEKFVRLERRAASGEGVKPLEGMEGKAPGRLLEVQYFPAGEKIPASFKDWTRAGEWTVRDVKAGNLVMWRDFTKEEREKMGEIDEARYAIAKTLHGMIHDVEVGRYLEWLSQNYAQADGSAVNGTVVEASERYRDTFKPSDWVQVPDSKIPGTSVLKYGKLAGRYLPGPIWNDLRQVVNGQFKPFGETYANILTMWKTSKTALSPAVHTNNVMSNFVMADWHEVSAGHMAKSLRIILSASKGSERAGLGGGVVRAASTAGIADTEAAREVLARYQDSGGDIGGWVTNEIRDEQLKPLLDALEKELAATAGQSVQAQVGVFSALQHALMLRFPSAWEAFKGGKKSGKVAAAVVNEGQSLIDLYQSEDDVFRLAAWLKAKEEGRTDLEAGKVARSSFLDYRVNAPWIQAMRSTAWPFISFSYRAVPMFLEVAGKKPHKLMKLMMLAGAVNALGVMLSGGDDEKERKLLPEEKAGKIWGMVPKLVRMPWNDSHGSAVYLDIRRFIPVGDVFDVGAGHSAVPMLPSLTPGGPLVMAGEIVLNKSAFTGKSITLETDTPVQQAGKVADYLYKAFAPNILGLPGTYATTGVADSIAGRTDAFGREASTAQAMASAFGVKLGSYPVDVMRRNLQAATAAQVSEIDKNIAQLKRQRQTNRISAEEFQSSIEAEQLKKAKLLKALAEKM